jgi:hypothetical protein
MMINGYFTIMSFMDGYKWTRKVVEIRITANQGRIKEKNDWYSAVFVTVFVVFGYINSLIIR